MGKPSSSTKKKRSKYSSLGHARKKSKTKGSKSNKVRLHDDSVSYPDTDSRSSVSVSSSSSEDSYRRRSSRSRTRKDAKGSKKRARTRSISSEDSYRVRRQKGSKRNDDSEVRKKTHEKKVKRKKKKKARRDASISSGSSGSWSCSTCQSPSSSSDESEYERYRGRSERRENNKRKLENIKNGTKRRRHRSRSCSSRGHSGSSDPLSEEKVTYVNTSQRLRSVVTLAKEDKEGRELDKDEHKEEMIYDHDDYPSCRSNDSNDVGNKESAHQLHIASEKKRPIEDDQREDASVSIIKTIKVTEPNEDEEDQYVRSKPGYNMAGTKDAVNEKTNKISGAVDCVDGDDLESVLRQKALENLRRFRGGPGGFHTNAKNPLKDKSDSAGNPPSTVRTELGQTKSPKDGGAIVVPGDSSHCLQNYETILSSKNGANELGSAKNNVNPPDQVAIAGREKARITVGSGISKPRLVTSALRQALSNATTTPMDATASQESSPGKLVIGSSEGKSASRAAHTVTPPAPSGNGNGNGNGDKVNNASGSNSAEPSSCLTSAAADIASNKLQDEGKESSQLEQKTMSVMRGGELVQVSYKVYIPKKAPALARRQLKR